jgi:hypothetical protein
MKTIRLISIVNFLFIFLLLSNAYAEYPTSTPKFIESPKLDLSNFNTTESSSGAADSSNSATQSSNSSSTLTWTGASPTNDYASNHDNWSGGEVPQNGVDVVFDSTSKNCAWDLTVNIASLKITSGYTGKITLSSGSNLTINKTVKWTGGGSSELASNAANWLNNMLPQNGYGIVFDNTSTSQKNCTWDLSINPAFLSTIGYTGTLTLNKPLAINGSLTISSGTLNLNNKKLDVDGYLLIGINGTLNATSSPIVTITVKGNWANYGHFTSGASTVILSGTTQYIYGDTTFYNLIKTVTTAGNNTLYFEAGSTQTILSGLTFQGASDNLLFLRSTNGGTYWNLNIQGAYSISYANIDYLNNLSSTNIITRNSVNAGHNSSNVSFGGTQCVCRENRRRTC